MKLEIFNSESPAGLQDKVNKWLAENDVQPVTSSAYHGDGWWVFCLLYEDELAYFGERTELNMRWVNGGWVSCPS